jgi:hypothetical protein
MANYKTGTKYNTNYKTDTKYNTNYKTGTKYNTNYINKKQTHKQTQAQTTKYVGLEADY